ncbi:MAG: LytTR family DNA-binding domain-containing protein [Bacteroidota bacterium]
MTTAHRDYAIEGFDLDVVDYLLKPISFERFLQTIKKIRKLSQGNVQEKEAPASEEIIYIKANRNVYKIHLADIEYVEAIRNHCKVVTTQETLLSPVNISTFTTKLDHPDFIRVHRSFIINAQHIHAFNANNLSIKAQMIPIGRSYKEEVRFFLESRMK